MQKAGISIEDRPCVIAAKKKEEQSHCFAGALEIEDGVMVTGKNTSVMGPCAAMVMNAIKYLAGIDSEEDLIKKSAFGPIQLLKTQYFGSQNPRLHTNEMLIALSLCAETNEHAKLALQQLKYLKGKQAHVTSNISNVDLSIFNSLGIQVTYEVEKE